MEKADPSNLVYIPDRTPVRGKDGDGVVLRHDLEVNVADPSGPESNCNATGNGEEEILDDCPNTATTVESETCDAISEMLSMEEPQVSTTLPSEKVIPYVEFRGHKIFKSTLVFQLNSNPFLFNDRLIRVKNSIYFNNSDDYISASSSMDTMLLGLGMDYGIYFMQSSTTTTLPSVNAVVQRKRGRPSKKLQPACVLNEVERGH